MKETRHCKRHGDEVHHRVRNRQSAGGYRWRCKACAAGYVLRRKRVVKATLIKEAGGCCRICGYNSCIRALHFHHVDPAIKGHRMDMGLTKSLEAFRKEAKKCVLLCANCHMEVEAGVTPCPPLP